MESVRKFETGATRDIDNHKLDYEGFLSPLVLEAFAEYMNKNRVCKDGTLRDGDNWQRGIPETAYMKSLWRHFMDVWKEHRGIKTAAGKKEALCAVMFNAMGMLFEELRPMEDQEDENGTFIEFGQGFQKASSCVTEQPPFTPEEHMKGTAPTGLLSLFRRN